MEDSPSVEIILAEEEGVMNSRVGLVQAIENAMDVGKQTEGNLVLTNRRLVYARGTEKEGLVEGSLTPFGIGGRKRVLFSDVNDIDAIPPDPANLSITIESLVSAIGHRRTAMAPKLVVSWKEGGEVKTAEFTEELTGGSRRRNLSDWGPVIEKLRAGMIKIAALAPRPSADTLEGKCLRILDDMQEKGLITIESEVEKAFGVDLDPEVVDEACKKLVGLGLVRMTTKPGEDPFYVKVSPIGEDDLGV